MNGCPIDDKMKRHGLGSLVYHMKSKQVLRNARPVRLSWPYLRPVGTDIMQLKKQAASLANKTKRNGQTVKWPTIK